MKIIIVDKTNIDDIPSDFNSALDNFKTNPYAKYIFCYEDKTLGYLYYSKIYDRIEINNIEAFIKRKGIGTLMMKELLKEELPITLEVSKENIAALELYKKFGFREVAIRRGYYNGIDGILMERVI